MALNAWNFSKEVIGKECKIIDGTRIHIDGLGHDIFHTAGDTGFGKIVNAHWNPNGVLVVQDDKGFLHHYLGSGHKFTSYNGNETDFTNSIEYKRAIEEYEESLTESRKGKKQKRSKTKESTGKKGSILWRFIKWIFKGIFKVLGLGVLIALNKDE